MRDKVVVGWNEYVEFPEWGIRRLGAKVDTGAKTSALHVEDIEELGRGRIRFSVVVHRTKRDRHFPVTTRVVRRARVRSSNGHYESRYFVRTWMRLGNVEKEVELSLVDRGKMAHRMLLGRQALQGDFVVDVSKRHLLDRAKKAAKSTTRSTIKGTVKSPPTPANKPTSKPKLKKK